MKVSILLVFIGLGLLAVWHSKSQAEALIWPVSQVVLRQLGEQLFFDSRLSADRSVSCASCHQPAKAFQDGLPQARGVGGQLGTRNTPSLLNVAQQRNLFWDGRRRDLTEQALDPLLNPREHGLATLADLAQRVRTVPAYAALWHAAPGKLLADVNVAQRVAQALAAYEHTLVDGVSSFDRFQAHPQTEPLTEAAQRGWLLFQGRAGCIACHTVASSGQALFTDQAFHALPQSMGRINAKLVELVNRFTTARTAGKSLDEILLSDRDMAELGRFVVTENPADLGRFKTPSLRNVAQTAPYMHDGSVATLEEAVDTEVYTREGSDGRTNRPLILTPSERADLVAFLRTLSGFSK